MKSVKRWLAIAFALGAALGAGKAYAQCIGTGNGDSGDVYLSGGCGLFGYATCYLNACTGPICTANAAWCCNYFSTYCNCPGCQ